MEKTQTHIMRGRSAGGQITALIIIITGRLVSVRADDIIRNQADLKKTIFVTKNSFAVKEIKLKHKLTQTERNKSSVLLINTTQQHTHTHTNTQRHKQDVCENYKPAE